MKKSILVISQYFFPEQFRINDITEEWVKRGYKVTVITGIPNYPKGKFYDGYGIFKKRKETRNGVDIVRIPLIPRGSNPIMLVMNYISFVVSGFFWSVFTNIKADFVFIFEVSPMTQALPGVWYSKRKNIPCYLYVQDLWPENVEIVTGVSNKTIIGLIGKMVDYIYSKCTVVFATSHSFVNAINERNVPKEKIKYWPQYAEDYYIPIDKNELCQIPGDNLLNIIFAGNIGKAQGLDILPKAAKLLKERRLEKKVRFNIVGDGRYKEELIALVNNLNVDDMFNFFEKQPSNVIPDFLAANDLAFISLSASPIFSMTIPAKLQSYMACGIPIIGAAEGETKRIIEESKCGLCDSPGDYKSLANNIEMLLSMPMDELKKIGSNAREYYDVHFNKENLLKQMDTYFR